MPHFDPYYASKLVGPFGLGDADAVLDLRGADRARAQAAIADLVEQGRSSPPRSVAVRLDPPPEGGGETLFQPVGRQLLEARKNGLIARLAPLPGPDGLGYFVVLAGGRDGGEAG